MVDPVIPLLPCSIDAVGGAVYDEQPTVLSERAPLTIAYEGVALTLAAFVARIERYDFGEVAPSQIVLHNTAKPAATWAPAVGAPNWDRDEGGLSEIQIKAKRLRQLDAIYYGYYRDSLRWDAGPHLFVDDRFVYLGTPLDTIGIHAGSGNSYRIGGKLRYSIGIEVVGRYASVRWPQAIITQLRGVVQALCSRLGITIAYTHAPDDQPARHEGQIAFHRDYTDQKDCPGNAIDPAWAVMVLSAQTPPPPPTPADPFTAWGPIDHPEGAAQGFGIPQAWLKNKQTLGRCLRGERYDLPNLVSRAMFVGGEIRYFAPTKRAEVLAYPRPLSPAEESTV